MPIVTLAKLLTDIRVMSGLSLTGEDAFDDTDIIALLNDAQQELDDAFAASNSHWRRKTYDFTLTNDPDLNYIDLAEVAPDFQITQGVDWLGSAPNPRNVSRLGSFVERNRVYSPHYFEDGTRLYIFGRNVAGPYRLHYTPQSVLFAETITREFDLATGDNPQVPPPGGLAGNGAWLLANAGFTDDIPEDGSVDLELTFTTTNLSFTGTYPIVEIGLSSEGFGTPTASCNNLVSTVGFTSPPTGSGTYTYQPSGTMSELPVLMGQWALFLKLHTSIAIRESQELEVGELEKKMERQQLRIKTMSKKRSDGIQQPGLTQNYYHYRNRYGNGGWSY